MRRFFLLFPAFVALIAATGLIWNFRFEHAEGHPVWSLEDLRNGSGPAPGVGWQGSGDQLRMRISRESGQPPVAFRVPLLPASSVSGLHVSFRLRSDLLIPGPEKWQDGRVFLEWHQPGNEAAWETDYVASTCLDWDESEVGMVIRTRKPAIPVLRFEHLGRSGAFELENLRIVPVTERTLWRWGKWVLITLWATWVFGCLSGRPGRKRGLTIAASVLWTTLAILWIVPGPWKVERSLVFPFQIGDTSSPSALENEPASTGPANPTVPPVAGPVVPMGKTEVQGSLFLKAKHLVAEARPLLHTLMLAIPTALFVWLTDRRSALFLACFLALGIESAQVAFGYGFGWDDVMDLFTDGLGIALGLWLAARPVFRSCLRRAVDRYA